MYAYTDLFIILFNTKHVDLILKALAKDEIFKNTVKPVIKTTSIRQKPAIKDRNV